MNFAVSEAMTRSAHAAKLKPPPAATPLTAAILFLASDEAAFVTGVALPVDGGYTAA